jgi:hypothetical protein
VDDERQPLNGLVLHSYQYSPDVPSHLNSPPLLKESEGVISKLTAKMVSNLIGTTKKA